jgi:hypothetical protein
VLTLRRWATASSRWLLMELAGAGSDDGLFLYPDDPQGLAKIIVDNLPASFWGASTYHFGPGPFCFPSCVQSGDYLSERCALSTSSFK